LIGTGQPRIETGHQIAQPFPPGDSDVKNIAIAGFFLGLDSGVRNWRP
jgi:hypothetical protein